MRGDRSTSCQDFSEATFKERVSMCYWIPATLSNHDNVGGYSHLE